MGSNSGDVIVEPEAISLYNDPLMLHIKQNFQDECTFVFKSINNDIISNRTLVFNPSSLHRVENNMPENFSLKNNFNLEENLTFCLLNEKHDPHINLSKVQSPFENIPKDQPEFIDINSLTFYDHIDNKSFIKESVIISDDENDVIFVKEYKNEGDKEDVATEAASLYKDDGIRRNPVRKARTIKPTRHLQKEHLLEEDFGFLDQFDEENLVFLKNKPLENPSPIINENYKEWPINAYERPEYNPETNKIEPFDYTIREIQNQQDKKKSQLETCSKVKRKLKKKYFIRRRKPKAKKPEKNISIEDLKDIVGSTFNLVSNFLKLSLDGELKEISETTQYGIYNLLKNQTALFSLVNNYGEKEVRECINKLLSKK